MGGYRFDTEFTLQFIAALMATARYPEKPDITDIIIEIPPHWIADSKIVTEEGWYEVTVKGEIFSIDYLIGESSFLNKGYGKEIIRLLTEMIRQIPTAKSIIVKPDNKNLSSCGVLTANDYQYYEDKKYFIYKLDIKETATNIRKVTGNKKEHLDLLLLADESESMIDKYLERGEMFVLEDGGVKAECVVTKEADGIYEIKNIAVVPGCQRKGYGKRLIDFLFGYYADCKTMLVGTGDVPSALNFYQSCGFSESHRIKNFFTDNYDHPMLENGQWLVDMVYLKRER